MIPTEPEVSDNGRYTVTETARLLEVSRQTIKRHTMTCLINPIFGKKSKKKYFSGKEIKKYWHNY